jgi:alginate O-acetyltransferase complex protein AlgI
LLTLAILSWVSALWLLVGIAVVLVAMEIGEQTHRRTTAFLVSVIFHVTLLLALRDQPALALIGGAYFTLRHIHVMSDWWIHRRTRPAVVDYLRYHLFLPVLAAGPIHRFEPFLRQVRRRRNDLAELAEGAERTLTGAFQFTVLSSYVLARSSRAVEAALSSWHVLPREMLLSAFDWIALYLAFAGLSSIAVGLSLMMGLRIEENFNRPWLANDLPDFWSRWHISLTTFSKDYIFRPVCAYAGSAMVGVLAAMMFIGVWHGSSIYWAGWGVWQGAGILLTLLARQAGLFASWPTWTARTFAASWLIATAPVVSTLTRGFG